jgi:hypothetical protein
MTSASRPGVSGPNRFEVNGANASLSFIRERGISGRRAQLVWDLVALNSTPSIALHKEPEVALGTMGIGLDYGGFGFELIPPAEMSEIIRAFPRLRMKNQFAETCRHLVAANPQTTYDNFLRDFGERFVPGYKRCVHQQINSGYGPAKLLRWEEKEEHHADR